MSRTVLIPAGYRVVGGLAVGLLLAVQPVYADGCEAEVFAGTWRNFTVAEGSDVVAADIRVVCSGGIAPAGTVEIALTVRCLRYECAWRPVPARYVPHIAAGKPGLLATFAEERVERVILVEAPQSERLRMTVTTRFPNVPLAPRVVSYDLRRSGQ